MTGPDSVFTQAIEDHLALKKQNATLEPTMPIARFSEDVGDPLDRYPGGPVTGDTAEQQDEVEVELDDAPDEAPDSQADASLAGMAPSLSLVDDLDRNNALNDTEAAAQQLAARAQDTEVMDAITADVDADVVRFPGGAGPREESAPAADPVDDTGTLPAVPVADDDTDLDAGDDPVIVIDTDEPSAPLVPEPVDPERGRGKRRWFGLGGRKEKADVATGKQADEAGWFSDTPRQFSWDD